MIVKDYCALLMEELGNLLLCSSVRSLGFIILGEIFVYVTVF